MLLRRYRDKRDNVKIAADLTSAAPVDQEKNLEKMTVDELKAYAEENGINLGKSSSQDGILKKIQEANEDGKKPEIKE